MYSNALCLEESDGVWCISAPQLSVTYKYFEYPIELNTPMYTQWHYPISMSILPCETPYGHKEHQDIYYKCDH